MGDVGEALAPTFTGTIFTLPSRNGYRATDLSVTKPLHSTLRRSCLTSLPTCDMSHVDFRQTHARNGCSSDSGRALTLLQRGTVYTIVLTLADFEHLVSDRTLKRPNV